MSSRTSSDMAKPSGKPGKGPIEECQQDPRMFAFPETLERLNEVGFTRQKSIYEGYSNGSWRGYTLDTGYLVAPQNFKSDEMYKKFPMNPHQVQTLHCGQMIMPIPTGPRTFAKKEAQDAQDLAQCVWVRGFYIPHDELRDHLKAYYKSGAHKIDYTKV